MTGWLGDWVRGYSKQIICHRCYIVWIRNEGIGRNVVMHDIINYSDHVSSIDVHSLLSVFDS